MNGLTRVWSPEAACSQKVKVKKNEESKKGLGLIDKKPGVLQTKLYRIFQEQLNPFPPNIL